METENDLKTAQGAGEESEIPEINFDEFTIPTYDEWKNEVITALKGGNFDKQMFTDTYEGITLNPIYRMEDTESLTQCKTYPGQQSELRGVHSAGYLSKLWTIAQKIDGKGYFIEPTAFENCTEWKYKNGLNFIAHCIEGEKQTLLNQQTSTPPNLLICIGPEGDFTPGEIELALQQQFIPVTLGDTRLRTETAGMVAAALLCLQAQ